MNRMTIFVTGGTGFIGRWAVAQLSRQGHRVRVLARHAQARRADYDAWMQGHGGNPECIELLDGDLAQEHLGLSEQGRAALLDTEVIYHMGAAFSWGLSNEEARQVTVQGSYELFNLAKGMPKLTHLVHLSGYMLASTEIWNLLGLNGKKQDGTHRLSEQQITLLYRTFGGYEAAKIESHFVMQRLAHEHKIPITGIQPSSVIGDSKTGEIDQPHGVPMLINNVHKNKLLLIPGTKNDWLPFVTVDYLVDFMTGVIQLPETKGKNYVVLDDQTPNFKSVIGLISQRLGKRAPTHFVSKKLIKFLLNLGLDKALGMSAETLDFLQPYQFDVQPAEQIARKLKLERPDIQQAIKNTVDYWARMQRD